MLVDHITERRAKVLDRWRERILASYPAETGRFLRGEGDRFANPVGFALVEGTAAVLQGLVEGRRAEETAPAVGDLIRIRAVQDLTPGQAVGFLCELKAALREELADQLDTPAARAEMDSVEEWVDRLLLGGFDLYVACRERVFAIRVDEIRNRSLKVMERLNEWRARRADPGDRTAQAEP